MDVGPSGTTSRRVTAIIAGGGVGQRFGAPRGKQLAEIAGKPVLAWSTDAVAAATTVDDIVVVCDPDRVAEYAQVISGALTTQKQIRFVAGGASRQDSVEAGIREADDAAIVIVHDGARPLVSPDIVDAAVGMLRSDSALAGVVVGHPAIDTIKRVDGSVILETPNRAQYWIAQTPQVFWRATLSDALAAARNDDYVGTDDSSLVERMGGRVAMVEGGRDNIKVTVSEDRYFAEHVLDARTDCESGVGE